MTRGRKPGFVMPEEHRTKIRNSKILNRLIDYVEGKEGVHMEPAQVTAGLGLLRKVMPDLSQSDATVTHIKDVAALTDAEINARIAELRGATASDGDEATPLDPSQLN